MLKTSAIVIREIDYRDNDKILTLFSPTHGKVDVLARSCKKSTSKLLASSQLFCCGDYQLTYSKNKYYHSGCDISYTFYDLRKDYDKIITASFFLEIVGALIMQDQPNKLLYALLINSLYSIEKSINPENIVIQFFLIKLCDLLGIMPSIDGCCQNINDSNLYLCYSEGIICCENCKHAHAYDKDLITKEQILTLHRASHLPTKAICEKLDINPSKHFNNMLLKFLKFHTDIRIKSYKLL